MPPTTPRPSRPRPAPTSPTAPSAATAPGTRPKANTTPPRPCPARPSSDRSDVNVAANTATVTFSFSEAPTDFTLAHTSAVGGTLSNLVSVDATHYTATFTAAAGTDIANGSVSVDSTWHEANGNLGTGSTSTAFVVDTVTPPPPGAVHNSDRYDEGRAGREG